MEELKNLAEILICQIEMLDIKILMNANQYEIDSCKQSVKEALNEIKSFE